MMLRVSVVIAMVVAATDVANAASFPARLKAEFDRRPMCATLDFDNLRVDVEDGIVRHSKGESERVREGDRLELVEADVSSDGLDVELEFISVHTRGDTVDVELVFYRSLRGPNNELVNLDDFWKAVFYFARDCEGASDDAG